MNILFVCTGNTCRSPMAAAVLKARMPDVHVQSAGIFAYNGQPAATQAVTVLAEAGIPLEHKSQSISPEILEWADLVLTMTTSHKQALIIDHPDYQDKYFTLKEYASESDKEIWKELRELYAELEAERHQLPEAQLREKAGRVQELERHLIDYDIQDPFGGSVEQYKETLRELEQYIQLLADTLKRKP